VPVEEEEDPDVMEDLPEMQITPAVLKMTWGEFMRKMRLTHALPYCYYQGKTLRGKRLLLMSTRSPHFTMRHLIMALGRVTNGANLGIATKEREAAIMAAAKRLQQDMLVHSAAVEGETPARDLVWD
jgi:hypothetical protein